MLIFGHRGFSAKAPENTLAAFELAFATGADGVELDLRLSGDDQIVIIHDTNLQRSHGKPQLIASLGTDQLSRLEPPIPTLQAVLDIAPPNSSLNLEIKPDEHTKIDTLVAKLKTLLALNSKPLALLISSFDPDIIRACQQQLPAIPRAMAFENNIDFTLCLELQCQFLSLHHSLVHNDVVTQAKLHGLKITTWTVNDPNIGAVMATLGVHSLISDNPEAMLRLR